MGIGEMSHDGYVIGHINIIEVNQNGMCHSIVRGDHKNCPVR